MTALRERILQTNHGAVAETRHGLTTEVRRGHELLGWYTFLRESRYRVYRADGGTMSDVSTPMEAVERLASGMGATQPGGAEGRA